MPAPFGFGVSDIIEGITLIVAGVKALDDAHGAKKSYREFVECLTSLLDSLSALDNLDLPEQLEQSQRAIRGRVARIRAIIAEFVATTTKYQQSLSEPGLSWTDGIRKIQWQLCKKKDLDSFHERLRRQEQGLLTFLFQVKFQQDTLIFSALTDLNKSPILQNGNQLLQDLKTTQTQLEQSLAHVDDVRDISRDVQGIPSEVERVLTSVLPSMHTPHLGAQDIQRIVGAMHLQVMAMLQEIRSGVQPTGADPASSQDSAAQTTDSQEMSHAECSEREQPPSFDDSPSESQTDQPDLSAFNAVTMRADDVDGTQYIVWRNFVTIKGLGHFSVTLFRASRSRSRGVTFHARAELVPVPWLSRTGLRVDVRFGRDPWRNVTLAPELATFAVVPASSNQVSYALRGECDLLRRMIADRKASPQDRNEYGDSLLHIAIEYCHWDVCLMLLQEGADVHASSSKGTPVDLFYSNALKDIWSLNKPPEYLKSPELASIRQSVQLLLKNYVHHWDQEEIEKNYYNQWIRLLLSAHYDHSLHFVNLNSYENVMFRFLPHKVRHLTGQQLDDIVDILTRVYRSEIDFETFDIDGMTCVTALAFLSTHIDWPGYFDLFVALLKAGLNANSRTSRNQTAFHMALYGCCRTSSTEKWVRKIGDTTIRLGEVIRVLLKFGCDIFAEDERGETPTQLASHLSNITPLDMSSVWYNALRRAGIDFEQILNVEHRYSNVAASTSIDTTQGEYTGVRRRTLPSIQQTGHRASVNNIVCRCIWCCTKTDDEGMDHQLYKRNGHTILPTTYFDYIF